MTGVETRGVSRDSLFLLAAIRIEQGENQHRIRVRNLSDGGMMGEGSLPIRRGHRVEVELRNLGWVAGTVAWVQDSRFGIAFDDEVDSQAARRPVNEGSDQGSQIIKPTWSNRAMLPPDPARLRKI